MRYSDDLFQLIQSMTKAEKRYFRLVATHYKQEKIYLRLFDELNRQRVYDEEKLRERFGEEIYGKQFHVAKNYLYKMIMKVVRNFNRSRSKEVKVEELIAEIRFLYNRGLFSQARKLWKQADRVLQTIENSPLKLVIVDLQQQLSGKATHRMEHLEDIHNSRMSILSEIEQKYQYDYLNERIGNICTNSPRRSAEQKAELAALMTDPLLSHPPTTGSWRVLNSYYWSHASYYYALGEYHHAVEKLMKSKSLYCEEPSRKVEYVSEYIMLIGNLLTLMTHIDAYDRFAELLDDLRTISEKEFCKEMFSANRSRCIYWETIYLGELQLETTRGNFEHCLKRIPEILEFLNNTASYRSGIQRNSIWLLIAYSYFASGEMTHALSYINQLLSGGEPQKGRSVYYTARKLELMIHYELGNFDLLESLERSLRTRLASQGLAGSYETRILRFFRSVLSNSTVNWDPEFYQPTEKPIAFAYIDFPVWIKAKKSGEDFRCVVRWQFLQKLMPTLTLSTTEI
ncbi:MAG: hypothetical protein AB7H80_15065 [Candidatus Kapaibacterium sp.]